MSTTRKSNRPRSVNPRTSLLPTAGGNADAPRKVSLPFVLPKIVDNTTLLQAIATTAEQLALGTIQPSTSGALNELFRTAQVTLAADRLAREGGTGLNVNIFQQLAQQIDVRTSSSSQPLDLSSGVWVGTGPGHAGADPVRPEPDRAQLASHSAELLQQPAEGRGGADTLYDAIKRTTGR